MHALMQRAAARQAVVAAQRGLSTTSTANGAGGDLWLGPEKAAGREVVGYGHNGEPVSPMNACTNVMWVSEGVY